MVTPLLALDFALKPLVRLPWASVILGMMIGCTPSISSPPLPTVSPLPLTAKVTIGSTDILLEVATTPEEQAQGLMFRTQLPGDRGMLFNFEEPRVARFWMKNTLIPLDIIFLRQGRVKHILANVPPCKADPCPVYSPLTEVDQVLELKAGQAKTLGLTVDQSLKFVPLTDFPPQ